LGGALTAVIERRPMGRPLPIIPDPMNSIRLIISVQLVIKGMAKDCSHASIGWEEIRLQ
jgi:hypothetical protein